ncbi:ricin-type beta-trefoil lectin domain protein [Actinoplanes sp. LDG1-06]|uniref:Ricin-type beta-trefoil lectin domain protein n=1 Tax=Paractinoplanes ovalisporus TaxID=2810368 RepID=A0ABS2ATB0_9ACTN|nr:RICIN domain-containing protein [Actinoplanes ovalisporus]MBM2623051.1 ricin-type beta-trefoil lectin domain protein [Actinoplanes ovalisporus]
MTDGDRSGEQDPLLVRPFVLRDSGALDDPDATQTRITAPAAAPDPADAPTAILHLPFRRKHAASKSSSGRRRVMIMAGVSAVVVLGAAAAGYAALRSDEVRPSVATAPGAEIPAAQAPVPTTAAISPSVSGTTGDQMGRPASTAGGVATSPSASVSAGATSAAVPPVAGSPTAGEPISLTPSPESGGGRTNDPQLVAPEPPASDRTGVIRGQNGLCLDLNGAIAVDGNHVQVFDCNETVAQTWTLATDGTVRVMGKCALVVGGDRVEIVTCDGRTPAQWRVSGQRLINSANGGCLTDPSGGRSSGTGVTVSTCTGSASQRWSLP